jgi:hypothetical protein
VIFSDGHLARRLRRVRSSPEALLRGDKFVELDDIAGALCEWARSLPWVTELPAAEPVGAMCRFNIDCSALACGERWFAVVALAPDVDAPEVLVVLPDTVARRGVRLGWAADCIGLGGDSALASLPIPTTFQELRALEHLLELAYSAAFRRAGQRE